MKSTPNRRTRSSLPFKIISTRARLPLFYILSEGNSKYSPDEFVVEDATRVILQKIEMCLYTNKGEVMADIDLGCDLEFLLWNTRVSTDYVRSVILQQFQTYIPELFTRNFSLEVSMIEGNYTDQMVIALAIDEYKIEALIR